jgi:putative phosphoribosyl transferase
MSLFSSSEGTPLFRDRFDAGRQLAREVRRIAGGNPLVLALPRGGVPVAYEVAQALRAELDVFLVRKLGVPGQEELALGAIASGGIRVLNEDLLDQLQLPASVLERVTRQEQEELRRREALYRQGDAPLSVANREVILVDDGLATGASMKAACSAVRSQTPASIMVAVPVAARETCLELQKIADRLLCLHTPARFLAVGLWYEDFSQTRDQDVQILLQRQRHFLAGLGRNFS